MKCNYLEILTGNMFEMNNKFLIVLSIYINNILTPHTVKMLKYIDLVYVYRLLVCELNCIYVDCRPGLKIKQNKTVSIQRYDICLNCNLVVNYQLYMQLSYSTA